MNKIFMFKAPNEKIYAFNYVYQHAATFLDKLLIHRAKIDNQNAGYPYLAIVNFKEDSKEQHLVIPKNNFGFDAGLLKNDDMPLDTPERLAEYLHRETSAINKPLTFMVDFAGLDSLMNGAAEILRTQYKHEVVLKELDTTLKNLHIFKMNKQHEFIIRDKLIYDGGIDFWNQLQSINPEIKQSNSLTYIALINEFKDKFNRSINDLSIVYYGMGDSFLHKSQPVPLLPRINNNPLNLAELIYGHFVKKEESSERIKFIIQFGNNPLFEEAYQILREEHKINTVTNNLK